MASRQINEYTKTRVSGTAQPDDLMDLDSTEDAGSTFESAKMKVSEFISYLGTQLTTFYTGNGTLPGNRQITASTFFTKWLGGDVTVEMVDGVNDYGLSINDNTSTEKGRLGFDQATSSSVLQMSDSSGLFLEIVDGVLALGTPELFFKKMQVKGDNALSNYVTFEAMNGNGTTLILARNDGFVSFLTTARTGLNEQFRVGGDALIQNTYITANGVSVNGAGGTNTINFEVKNDVDNEYLVATSGGGAGRVGIGDNAASPSGSSVLDLSSTTMGFLSPRMTTVQRDAIAAPIAGLEIYNTTTNKKNFYNGTIWEAVTSA